MCPFRLTALILVHLIPIYVCGQVNSRLKTELDSIYSDQLYRDILGSPQKKDSLAKANSLFGQEVDQRIFDKMTEIDQSNIKRVKQIIKQYGYPGTKLVDFPTNEAAWYVIQHSEKNISEYFPLIEKAGKNRELPADLVAMMQDRLLMGQGKEQVYGTQVRCEKSEYYVWSISNPAHVNQRRKQAGFKTTVEQNAKGLGVEFKVRTLSKSKI